MSTAPARTAPPPEESLWTVKEAAAYLKSSTSYVYKGVERGEIPCLRIGAMVRFEPARLRAWALGQTASNDTANVVQFRR